MKRNKDEARRILMETAGKLFIDRGIASVTVTDISEACGIDACMINRYFGGKDGLIEEVINSALNRWKEIDMRKFYENNKLLLKTRDGQKAFVAGLVESVFKTLGNAPEDDDPGKSMLLQLMQYPSKTRDQVIDMHLRPLFNVFYDIYRTITQKEDCDDAFCWFLILVCPQCINTASLGLLDALHPMGKVDASFGYRFQFVTTQVLLSGLGLLN